MPLRRPSTSDGQSATSSSPSSTFGGTRRRFPLLGRSKKNRNSELIRPTTGLPTPASPVTPQTPKIKKPGLRVHVQVKFEAPLNQGHVRDYEASPQLVASDRLCQALLSRLQHCSAELISRHDCSALDPLRKPHRDVKPLRYRITYRVERDGLTLNEKSLRSFQEYAPTADDSREVLSAIDRIVGLFLVRHDPGFKWPEPPEAEPVNPDSETVRPYTGRPQPTCCVPRSRFVHTTQSFELVPGYTIELFLRSRCATRYPENRNASIKIDSRQPTPLTLLLGEELITRASNLIIDPIDSCKRKFDKRHRNCNGFEGSGGCTHVEDGAVDVMVKVRNNLGPDYNYFSHRIQTSKVLFNDPNGRDFDEFANAVKAKLEKARDMSDKSLRSLDDLTLRIRELRGQNWSVHEPLTVRLDSSVTYCRQTVEAIMERLQAGISNVLESHEDALATMTVHKRGHLIFDGFLDGAGGDDNIPPEKFSSADLERKALESKLKERIRADITMLCKDTCSLDCNDYLPNLKIRTSGASAGPRDNTRPENVTRPENSTRPRSFVGSVGSGSTHSEHTLAKKQAQKNLRETTPTPSTPATPASLPSADLSRVPSGVEMAKKYGYMADYIADDEEHQSEPPSTPSLVDTDSLSPRDSILVTPQSVRAMPQDQSNEGLRIVDDGRRVIYQEQSDIDAIARGVTEFHRYEEDEPVQLIKEESPAEALERKATRRSLDTRMPDLSGNVVTVEATKPTPAASGEEKLEESEAAAKETKSEIATVKPAEDPTTPVATPLQPEQDVTPIEIPVTTAQTQTSLETVQPKPDDLTPEETALAEIPLPVASNESEKSREEQWEIVESPEAPPAPAGLGPHEVDVSSKSQTSIGSSTSAPSIQEDVKSTEDTVVPADQTAEKLQEANVESLKEISEPAVKPELPIDALQQAVETAPQESSDSAEEQKTAAIINDFPDPPHEPQHEVKEEIKEKTPIIEAPAQEPSSIHAAEDSAIDVNERQEAPAETAVALQPESVRSSGDSGISMHEQSRAEEPKGEEAPKVEETAKEEVPAVDEPEKREMEDEPELPDLPKTVETLPTEPVDVDSSTEEQAKAAVSEDGEYFPVFSLASSPMLEPVAEENEPEEAPKKLSLNLETPALTTSTSTPMMEKLLTPEERSHIDSHFEEHPEPPRFDSATLPRMRPRANTNTLPERRYSTALTLEIDTEILGPEWASQNASPVGSPKTAMGLGRPMARHRRQPSAGWLGLREQRMHEVGLRNALVPYRWRAMRVDGDWDNRPRTSHSEQ